MNHEAMHRGEYDGLDAVQEAADLAALSRGIADAEAGRTLPLEEAIRQIDAKLRARFAAA
jgi:predicted transcriptional regulator